MEKSIKLKQVSENNLKNIDVEIPYYKHTVITGVSGSGKSTLAYDVIYATAQRNLLDCMSDQDRRLCIKMKKPKVRSVEGLTAVISLKQVMPNINPRSTIGTFTSIGSYVRNLMALHAKCRCIYCDNEYRQTRLHSLIKDIEGLNSDTVVEVCFPYFFHTKSDRMKQLHEIQKRGYRNIYIKDERFNIRDIEYITFDDEFILVVEGKFIAKKQLSKGDINCIKSASNNGDKFIALNLIGGNDSSNIAFYNKNGCREHHMITLKLEDKDFSYNEITCACPVCMGSGVSKSVHPAMVIKNSKKALCQGPFYPEIYSMSKPYNYMSLYSLAVHYGFSFHEPYEKLPKEAKGLIMYGSGEETFLLQRPIGYDKALPNYLAKEGQEVSFHGILRRLNDLYIEMQNDTPSEEQERFFKAFMYENDCLYCQGTRLKKSREFCLLNGKTYTQLGKLDFTELYEFLDGIRADEVSLTIIDVLKERLLEMKEIGLEYLCFDRRIDSLSGGEYQRLRLVNQVGSGLVGLIYIIDEPTNGLHGSDNKKVLEVIKRLIKKGNTVITIEHDYDVIREADYIIEMGPGAGIHGGEVVTAGTLEDLQKNPKSIVGRYALQLQAVPVKPEPFNADTWLCMWGIEENNIKNADIDIPLHKMTCFTGVSGSGKSTIVYDVLYKAYCSTQKSNRIVPGKYRSIDGFDRVKNVICIDQSPIIGKSNSIPATFLDIFNPIRELFANYNNKNNDQLDSISYFSFNSKGGCPACRGKGYIENYIPYFGETRLTCQECNGQQFIEEVLDKKYNEKNIKQVLDMTFSDALTFFEMHKAIVDKVKLVCDLGLGYMQLGQQLSTLSGGEAQRLKLAREMGKYKKKENILYILDEPSSGLHADDISRLTGVLSRITKNNNTVILVEHNPDMIMSADYLIDLGPGGGKHGGEVLFCGTPADLVLHCNTKTAEYLRHCINLNGEASV